MEETASLIDTPSAAAPQGISPADAPQGAPVRGSRSARSGQDGFTLLDMLFVVGLIGLLSSMAIPGLTRAKGAAQAASALGTMRFINSAELSFAITCGLGFYSPDFPTLGMRPPGSPEAFLPKEFSSGFTFVKSGYTFSLAGTPLDGAPASCNGLGAGQASPGYAAVADPIETAGAVVRFFGTNSDGIIYQHSSTLSTTMPETGGPAGAHPIQ
jgi:hypothetical protein